MRPQITIGYPPREEIDDILREQCKGIKKEVEKLIDLFWMLWIDYGGKIGAIAPRDAIYLFGWASKLSSFETTGGPKTLMESTPEKPYQLTEGHSFTGIRPEHLKLAFQKLFTDRPAIKD
jgi:hypothetical protein